MSEPKTVTIIAPEPNTPEMITCLYSAIEQLMEQLPFDFSQGDLMGACMYHIVDAGRVGIPDMAQLRVDVMRAFDRIVEHMQAEGGRKH